ncbi:hypothetical protein SS37A_42430 (plasmid) [Methylocystis iwaonis]|uniref:Ricin B lectin domain-containing protein n=1 Tax=Methylocystis iwaonis TaxID=2885079 RepID=A0ABN6VLQ2_9HYPH|nr:hypothetical protein SS37A_42430 [Methylocystis iwaonis]
MAGNIQTARLAPVGIASNQGLVMADATVGSARLVALSVLNPGMGVHAGWTLERVREDRDGDIYRIRNDDMGLYLTMSEGDQVNSRVLGGVLSPDPHLIPTQEWRFISQGSNRVSWASRSGLRMHPDSHEPGATVYLVSGGNDVWEY